MGNSLINFFIKIQNTVKRKNYGLTEVNPSTEIIKMAVFLKQIGYIRTFSIELSEKKKTLKIILKYKRGNYPIFTNITIISKPGKMNYITSKKLQQYTNISDLYILSTSHGFLTHISAYKRNIGGILLCRLSF